MLLANVGKLGEEETVDSGEHETLRVEQKELTYATPTIGETDVSETPKDAIMRNVDDVPHGKVAIHKPREPTHVIGQAELIVAHELIDIVFVEQTVILGVNEVTSDAHVKPSAKAEHGSEKG